MQIERREYDGEFQLRAIDGAKPGSISGYAAVFNKLSEDLGGFREQIAPGAFDGAIKDADIRVFWNHNSSAPLGRTRAGTAKVATDMNGLHFEVELPDTSYARDLWASVERGDVSGASIGFFMGEDSWSQRDGDAIVRTIINVSRLIEASVVSIPAYPDAEVAIQRMRDYKCAEDNALAAIHAEHRARELQILGA